MPARRIVIVTWLPFGPRSLRTTSSVVTSSLISSFSMCVMTSPARIPSLKAGVPSMGAMTVIRPIRFWIWIPSPKNDPCCFSRMAEKSSGSRNAVCGSRRDSIPWIDA